MKREAKLVHFNTFYLIKAKTSKPFHQRPPTNAKCKAQKITLAAHVQNDETMKNAFKSHFFLYIIIILLCHVVYTLTEDARDSEECLEEDKLPPLERGIYELFTFTDVHSIAESLSSPEKDTSAVLALIVFYDSECPHSHSMLERLEDTSLLLKEHFHNADNYAPFISPIIAKIDSSSLDKNDLKDFGIVSVPTLLFVYTEGTQTYILVYSGRHSTAWEVFQTTLLYFYRLIIAAEEIRYEGGSVNAYPRIFQDMDHIQKFITSHRQFFLEYDEVETVLHPRVGEKEGHFIHWLLKEDDSPELDAKLQRDDFVLLVQCRRNAAQPNQLYDTFNKMSQVLSNRRDRFFAPTIECAESSEDGSVIAWKISTQHDLNRIENFPQSRSPALSGKEKTDADNLVEFMVKVSTPSILWFDRESTGPIAFSHYRKVHAVLFLDLHHITGVPVDPDSDVKSIASREALRRFRRACRLHKRMQTDVMNSDLVCLIVPSTETRVLTTFGVDLWTPLDVAAMEDRVADPTLPKLLITDQRFGGTKRYYLDSKDILSSDLAVHQFINSFWSGALQYDRKSDPRGPRTTKTGIRILTADSMNEDLLKPDDSAAHALVLFTAPTCGHCKRFITIWRELASLLQDINWNVFLKLYQIDVTTNDIYGLNITVRWVPDLYYLTPDRQHAVRYNETDDLGDDVGKIGNALEILEWFLSIAPFEYGEVEEILEELDGIII